MKSSILFLNNWSFVFRSTFVYLQPLFVAHVLIVEGRYCHLHNSRKVNVCRLRILDGGQWRPEPHDSSSMMLWAIPKTNGIDGHLAKIGVFIPFTLGRAMTS